MSVAGPAMVLDFKAGGCTFNETEFFLEGKKELNCTLPSLTYVKAPGNFTSKFTAGEIFTTSV